MTRLGRDHVIDALRDPHSVRVLDAAGWDLLVRQARRADLLARLAGLFDAQGLTPHLPAGPAAHFESARQVGRAQQAEVLREIEHIRRALLPLGVPITLLKGAAYVAAGLPAAAGRLFSDIDILLPQASLGQAEAALMLGGWASTHHSAYDQRYYRQWMHELPPMMHVRRQTALDVHHAITPLTARWPVDSARLQAAAVALPGTAGLAVLAPADMVLHSMVHLLLNEELSHGLRDLSDIDLLLRHFGAEPAFWPGLAGRAESLGLARALYHAVDSATGILGTPVPLAMRQALAAVATATPAAPLAALMRGLWRRALRSPHPSAGDRRTPISRWALYLRAHWLRMPPLLLARHLGIKALGLHITRAERELAQRAANPKP